MSAAQGTDRYSHGWVIANRQYAGELGNISRSLPTIRNHTMGTESPEVQMARLEERLKVILARLDEARSDQQAQQHQMGLITQTLQSMSNRVENVESSLATAKPTIEEFITIKHRVVGAGMMGKWVWAIAGGLLGMLFSARVHIMELLK